MAGVEGVEQNFGGRLFVGLLLLALGAGLLLVELGIFPGSLRDLWPLGVVVVGFWIALKAIRRADGRGLTAGIVALAIGGYYLAVSFTELTDQYFLPVLLLALGLGVTVRALVYANR